MNKPKDIDEYIVSFPDNIQKILQQLRTTIKKSAPDAEEVISYGIPAYRQNGILVYFAVHKSHIGFYPTPTGIEAFKKEIAAYKWAKGSVQFPLDKPLPLGLITEIVKFRVKENSQKAKKKLKRKH
jgi:uncharacterized protein YdhG (YjbR/CyaY superfamily)